jgi:hypothetical protein
MGFDLQVWSGYAVAIPVSSFTPRIRPRLTTLIKVEPLAPQGEPVFLARLLRLPSIPERPPKQARFATGGGFSLGEGRYRVKLIVVDEKDRYCMKQWEVKAKPGGGDRALKPGEVTDATAGWHGFPAAEDGKTRRKATVLINAYPVRLRRHSAVLSWRDQATLLNVLTAILSRGGFGSARVVAFDLNRKQVIFDEPAFRPSSFRSLTEAMGSVDISTVDYSILASGPSERQFLASLAQDMQKHTDAGDIIIVTPSTPPPDKPGPRIDSAWEGLDRPDVLALLPRPLPEGSVIDVAKGAKGRVFSIYSPSDLASALRKIGPSQN